MGVREQLHFESFIEIVLFFMDLKFIHPISIRDMASSRLGEEIERLYSRVNEQEREIRKKQGVLVSVLDDARVAEKEKDQGM